MLRRDDSANPGDNKSVVCLSHAVQKMQLLIGSQAAQDG